MPRFLQFLSFFASSLYNNSISEVNATVFDGLDIEYIFLDMNNLQTLPSKVQHYLATRKKASLTHNPWRCDCDLVYLIHSAQISAPSHTETTCSTVATVGATPSTNEQLLMTNIPISKLLCPAPLDCLGQQCVPCARGLQRRVDGHCVCMEGTQPSRKLGRITCEACPQHHFKSSAGNFRCQRCSPGSMAAHGPASMCACAAGYQNNGQGDCQKCPLGTYRLYGGVGPCSPCPRSGLVQPQPQCETRRVNVTVQTQREAGEHLDGGRGGGAVRRRRRMRSGRRGGCGRGIRGGGRVGGEGLGVGEEEVEKKEEEGGVREERRKRRRRRRNNRNKKSENNDK
ncbi:receptor protein-tyrosine kinase [Plakobranchus ocellatus]|uniref:Receptor protein-tyrosine kinase n=1 Tax=Plakobranchus ocellatus TaxID=259542 RepID=A0AAV4AI59_9GAST|nr:receptor protein-tyrosine kinase [Plakobranchus ocellatus]